MPRTRRTFPAAGITLKFASSCPRFGDPVMFRQKEVPAMKLSVSQKQRLQDAFKQFEENQNSPAFLSAVEQVTGVMAHSTQSYQILRFAESSCTNPHDPENKPVRSDPNLLAACARAFVSLVETVG
jgi:hypothetical protein